MADTMTIKWNKKALGHAIGTAPETLQAVTSATERLAANAQAMGGGFRTAKWRDPKTGEWKGDTPAEYRGDVRSYSDAHVGIVYTANYAAQKDNMLNNTLLKAVGTHG